MQRVFCLPINDEQSILINKFFGNKADALMCLSSTRLDSTEESLKDVLAGLMSQTEARRDRLRPLSHGRWLPDVGPDVMAQSLALPPASVVDWRVRNLAMMALFGHLVYWVDELSLTNTDLAALLTAARVAEVTTIGLFPPDWRGAMDAAVLTMTDVLVVTEEPRSVSRVLASLT